MQTADVEDVCSQLSPLLKNTIRTKLLAKGPGQPKVNDYDFGEALVFFVADWLSQVKLLTAEQLRLVLEEYGGHIQYFGDALEAAWAQPHAKKDVMTLPSCKLGFLDRRLACIDGCTWFIDLSTGKTADAIEMRPLETVSYNLTALFIRYFAKLRKQFKSADLKGPAPCQNNQ